MPVMRYQPGDGHSYLVAVEYIAHNGPRNEQSLCSFCDGDPYAEETPRNNNEIHLYFAHNPTAKVCPMCNGAAS